MAVQGYDPSMQVRPVQRQQGGFTSSLASILGLSTVGALTGAGVGGFMPIKEDTFIRQYTKDSLKADYDKLLEEIGADKTKLADEIKTMADGDPKTRKTLEFSQLEKRETLLKKQGPKGYADKMIERVKVEAPTPVNVNKPDPVAQARIAELNQKVIDLETSKSKVVEIQGANGAETKKLRADARQAIDNEITGANTELTKLRKINTDKVIMTGENANVGAFRTRLKELAEKGKQLFTSKGGTETEKELFGKVVKNAHIEKAIEYAKKVGMYTAIGVGVLMILKGIFFGKPKEGSIS